MVHSNAETALDLSYDVVPASSNTIVAFLCIELRSVWLSCEVQPWHNSSLSQHWNGHFFDKITLSSVGLRVQLGHGGGTCPCPQPGPPNFLVFDVTGVHPVSVDFCDCGQDCLNHWHTQLLRSWWFPTTFNRPQTVFTFELLDTFHELTLQGKTTLYDFYYMILRKSDNPKLGKSIVGLLYPRYILLYWTHPKSRYPEFHRVVWIWRHLQMLKWAGGGHDPAGADGTSEGELAVECPICPHPGCNLPDGWERAPPELMYVLPNPD